ncbi:hypothetical protein GH714_040874 [Hevea brasiliensis]|uniref:Uncharacterized protein n=1 Tax=Hevea brasiliensis TaxID=3981 RepID=A0A6A6MVU1_HEVBR|nr:hypothetical protein GH714_040874 [Hevea brasiliensis]
MLKERSCGCFSTFQNEGSRKETALLESKCKKVGKRTLDLELPADEYIDSEQEESLAGETASPEVSCYPMKNIAEDVQKSVVEPFHGINDGNLVFQDYNVSQAPFSRKTKCLADLNEPIKLEEETNPESNVFLGPVADLREIPCRICLQKEIQTPISTKGDVQNIQTRVDPEAFSSVLHLDKDESRQECLSDNAEAVQSSGEMNSFPARICTEKLSASSKDVEIEQASALATSHLLNLNSGKLHRERKDFDLESNPEKTASARKHTQLNSFLWMTPASPENKETSPPGGESDENQLEMPCELPKQESRDLLEDLITVAAETIVSMSSSQVQTTEIMTSKPAGASQNDPLYWFSKIASSVVDDPESEFGVV